MRVVSAGSRRGTRQLVELLERFLGVVTEREGDLAGAHDDSRRPVVEPARADKEPPPALAC